MKHRKTYIRGFLDRSILTPAGVILNLHNTEMGELAFGDVPNRGKVEVVVSIYQWDNIKYTLSGRQVFLTGYLVKSETCAVQRTAGIILGGVSRGDIEFSQIVGLVEIIVPLHQKLIEPKDAVWCQVPGGSYYLINKYKVLAVVGGSGTWNLRVGVNQQCGQAATWAAGKEAVLNSLAIQELEGFRYAD